jgi:formylglycine-generating enzyme required for sulfatase activity
MDAEREQNELLEAVRRNPGVRRLAANPLLLTILALMKRKGVTLPERRVELYEQYVRTLLSMWNRARSLGGRIAGKDLDVVETVRILAPLALWMHATNPGAGLARRADLQRQLEEIFRQRGSIDADGDARRLLEDVHENTALLLERGAGEYGFIHLTFEEYLAAVGIALQGQGDAAQITATLRGYVGQSAWHEVILLTVAYVGLIQQLERVAGEVVERLAAPGAGAEATVLAGEAVVDAQSGVSLASREMVTQALPSVMQSGETEPVLRRRAGLALGRLGWLPSDLDDLALVKKGVFLYGDKAKRRQIPYDFWIGKYPVTNVQFARFIEDGGYHKRGYWDAVGWEWRKNEKRQNPGYWNNSNLNNPMLPVVGVTWFEAQAFCRWLDDLWHKSGTVNVPQGYACRLPTEEEWEYAARGADGRPYPWGEDDDLRRFNVDRKAGGTTCVATYPQGASPCGAWDMSGNVWEWTASWFDEGKDRRVLRGGSWFSVSRDARCASRIWYLPDYFIYHLGFRYVLSLASSES